MLSILRKSAIFIIIILYYTNLFADIQEDKIKLMSKKYEDIMRIVVKNYVDSVDIEKITEEGFKAILKSLDNQSVYFDRDFYKSNKEVHTGKQIGLGMTIIKYKDTIAVQTVVFNSPSYLGGVKAGDRLYRVDTSKVINLSEFEINNLLNGEENTKVTIEVFRKLKQVKKENTGIVNYNNDSSYYINNGFELQKISLTRKSFAQSSISACYQKNEYGYIKLGRFTNVSDRDIIDTLKKFNPKKMKYLIIDVRGNGGGYLDQVVNICGLFLDSGQYVIKSKATNPNYNVTKSIKKRGEYYGLPLKILVDKESASGSEILAGVVQDYDMGEVYGERTFGKGTVQNTWEFKDGTGFKITVAEYLTPLERPINKNPKNNTAQLDNSMKLFMNDNNFAELQKSIEEIGYGKLPIFKSSKGKVLIGGGGIFPNHYVKSDTTNILTQALISKRIIFDFVHSLINYNSELFSKIKSVEDFENNFQLTDEMLLDFKKISYNYNTWNQNMYDQDKDIIKAVVKSRIVEVLFGTHYYYRIYNLSDKVYLEAIKN